MRQAVLGVACVLVSAALSACGSSHEQPTKVVRAWADALRNGDVDKAADLFALPSTVEVVPGAPPQVVHDHADAVAFNLTLPCGGRLVQAKQRGRYVDALFLLADRPGSACDAPGATARAAFLIRDGKIAEWRRVGAEPGDERYEKRTSPRVGPVV